MLTRRFIRRASLLGYLPEGPAAETVRIEAQQIFLRVLRDVTWLEHMPSALAAAAALYWASCISTPGVGPPSSFRLFRGHGLPPKDPLPLPSGTWGPCTPEGAVPGAVMVVSVWSGQCCITRARGENPVRCGRWSPYHRRALKHRDAFVAHCGSSRSRARAASQCMTVCCWTRTKRLSPLM